MDGARVLVLPGEFEVIQRPQFAGWLEWRGGAAQSVLTSPHPSSPCQTLCFRVRKMIDVYKPDWCEIREDWSVYLFSPENRWARPGCGEVGQGGEQVWEGDFYRAR